MNSLIRIVTVAVLPIAFLISMTHIIGAESGPGDGFTAGVITALGLTLQYVSFGYEATKRRFRWIPYMAVLVIGLGVAVFSSIMPLILDNAFFALLEVTYRLPVIEEVTLSRAFLFDIGIYLVVFGGVMTAIDSLWRSNI